MGTDEHELFVGSIPGQRSWESGVRTETFFLEILLNQPEIKLYLPCTD